MIWNRNQNVIKHDWATKVWYFLVHLLVVRIFKIFWKCEYWKKFANETVILNNGGSRKWTFHNILRNRFVKGAPEFLKSNISVFLCISDFMIVTSVTQLEVISVLGLIRFFNARSWVATLHCQRQCGNLYSNVQNREMTRIF